jgi:uncharacterized protein VirK/YbjX
MVSQPGGAGVGATALEWLQTLAKLPSPDKVFAELQRLNNNLERIQLDKVLAELQRLNGTIAAVQSLPQTVQSLRVPELLRALNETNDTLKKFYDKIWGR